MADGIYNEKKFRNKIVFTTFILSILVVIIHSENIGQYSVTNDVLSGRVCIWIENSLVTSITKCAVPCFIFISGLLFYRNYTLNKMISKYKSRIRSIVIPYLLVNGFYTLIAVIGHFIPYVTNNLGENWSMESVTFSNILKGIFLFEYNKIFWFMLFLIVCISISPVIYIFIRNKYVGALVCFVVILVALCTENFTGKLYYLNFIYFILGGYLSIHFKVFTETLKSKKICYIAVVIYTTAIILYHIAEQSGNNEFIRLYEYCYPLFLVLSFYVMMDLFVNISMKDYMKKSFIIYEMQLIFLAIYKKLFRMLFPVNNVFAIITYFAVPVVVVISIVYTANIMEKKMPKVYRILAGGR